MLLFVSGAPIAVGVFVHFAPLPYNILLFLAVWRSAARETSIWSFAAQARRARLADRRDCRVTECVRRANGWTGRRDARPFASVQLAVEPCVADFGFLHELPVRDLDRMNDPVDLGSTRNPGTSAGGDSRARHRRTARRSSAEVSGAQAGGRGCSRSRGRSRLLSPKNTVRKSTSRILGSPDARNRGRNAERQDRVHPTRLTSGYNILAALRVECCQAQNGWQKPSR